MHQLLFGIEPQYRSVAAAICKYSYCIFQSNIDPLIADPRFFATWSIGRLPSTARLTPSASDLYLLKKIYPLNIFIISTFLSSAHQTSSANVVSLAQPRPKKYFKGRPDIPSSLILYFQFYFYVRWKIGCFQAYRSKNQLAWITQSNWNERAWFESNFRRHGV